MAAVQVLERTTFRTSRLLEFCSRKELVAQTGHEPDAWPLVVLKELVDNGLDACEEAGIAPEIEVKVEPGAITVVDNGPGMPPETVADILDFSSRVSSREAYVAPDRGAQGNALKTILAMPFVLDGEAGRVEISARGLHHRIEFAVDALRQEPVIRHRHEESDVRKGTSITVAWPDSAFAQSWPGRESNSYKSPTTTPGSTRISASASPGSVSGPPFRRPSRRGQSGGRRTPPARTGIRPNTSSA